MGKVISNTTKVKSIAKTSLLQLLSLVLILGAAACEGPAGSDGSQGEQGLQGEQGEQGPKGEDGNANVIRYIFDGHDFSVNTFAPRIIDNVSESEVLESAWLVYLVNYTGGSLVAFHIPGNGKNSNALYKVGHVSLPDDGSGPKLRIAIYLTDGPSEVYEEIHVIRIEQSEIIDNRSKAAGKGIPADLDISDYEAVIEYYGLKEKMTGE